MKNLITLLDLTQGRTPFEGGALDTVARSWQMALEDIPTHHLEECFRRALKAKRDDFPLSAPAVNRAYDDYKPELLRQAQAHAAEQERLLEAGHGSLDRMTLDEWKTRHNLPAEWKLGDPFPPESDLHGKRVPMPVQGPIITCELCYNDGWTRIPFDAKTGRHVKLIRCKCQE